MSLSAWNPAGLLWLRLPPNRIIRESFHSKPSCSKLEGRREKEKGQNLIPVPL